MTIKRIFTQILLLAASLLLTNYALGQEVRLDQEGEGVASALDAGRDFPTQVFFGDTHVHTALSRDAFGFGTRLNDEDALRFARGEELRLPGDVRVKISHPLDFMVVADHAEDYGSVYGVYAGEQSIMVDPQIRTWNAMLNAGGEESSTAVREMNRSARNGSMPQVLGEQFVGLMWEKHTEVADQFNQPGQFTSFQGYEWSSTPGGNNLHRVVIFRDDADKVNQVMPLSATNTPNPEDLWTWMQDYEDNTGGSVLAIPHGSNLSSGEMFALETFTGEPLTEAYAESRMRWEPLMEATQIKGDSEAHPLLSPTDEFADYETFDVGNIILTVLKRDQSASDLRLMLSGEYARSALQRGLQLGEELGANPFKFGMIGSTDSHTALVSSGEERFSGEYAGNEATARIWNNATFSRNGVEVLDWRKSASGFAGVWATENTREAIFDAMQRKETYATTGSRMSVRFFGGWDFVTEDANNRSPADVGYLKGVPMGGDLTEAPQGTSPTFLIGALKDPSNGNLDRIQIIKGWLDADGETHERIYDVVWGDADSRRIGADGKLPAVGNTVDVANATWTNTIGAAELITVWEDPDFNPGQQAFYYARVLEIPTPRWTAYDVNRSGVEMSDDVTMWTQERAYTSPIWYNP